MHAYVDRVSKLDAPSKKHSTSGQQPLEDDFSNANSANNNLNQSVDKMMNRSQQQVIECISELDSENEFSYIKNGDGEDEEFKNDNAVDDCPDLPIPINVMHIKRLSR